MRRNGYDTVEEQRRDEVDEWNRPAYDWNAEVEDRNERDGGEAMMIGREAELREWWIRKVGVTNGLVV